MIASKESNLLHPNAKKKSNCFFHVMCDRVPQIQEDISLIDHELVG